MFDTKDSFVTTAGSLPLGTVDVLCCGSVPCIKDFWRLTPGFTGTTRNVSRHLSPKVGGGESLLVENQQTELKGLSSSPTVSLALGKGLSPVTSGFAVVRAGCWGQHLPVLQG